MAENLLWALEVTKSNARGYRGGVLLRRRGTYEEMIALLAREAGVCIHEAAEAASRAHCPPSSPTRYVKIGESWEEGFRALLYPFYPGDYRGDLG